MGVGVCIKKYASGKYTFISKGNPDFYDVVHKAFSVSCNLIPDFDKDLFMHVMRENNVPDDVIKEYLENYIINNDVFSSDQPDMEMMGDISNKFIITDR